MVEVPEAEPGIGPLRDSLDASAALGAPAHVTVLFPFMAADEMDDAVLGRVAAVVAKVPSFSYRFSHTGWFDDRVVWLAPDDDAPFRDLTERIWREFPAYPPFEGVFADVVPHLTIGHDQPLDVLRAAEREAQACLPITGHASDVLLLAQAQPDGPWKRRGRFPLLRRR